jgi:hypothetical protein
VPTRSEKTYSSATKQTYKDQPVIKQRNIRDGILHLHHAGQTTTAYDIWDLLDAYHALDLELTIQAGQSRAVSQIESLIATVLEGIDDEHD